MANAGDHEVILLNAWQSPFGARVRIALAEKGIEYEYQEENLFDKSPFLLRMNPVYKKVPVLIHNGKPISDSLNIVEYIDQVWKRKSCSSLLPDDPYERARARFWANFIDQNIYPNIRKIWLSKTEAEVGKKELIESLKTLEKELEERSYDGGDKFGLVDIALVGFYTRFYTAETMGGFKLKEECPKLMAWAKRCMQRESVLRSLPDPHKIYPNIRKIWLSKTEAEVGKKELIESLKTLEKELEERSYDGGDKFGLVDIALVGFYTRFYTAETMGGFKLKEECPKLMAWAKRCMQRESVLHSLPDPHKVLDFCLQLKHKLAMD